MRYAVDDTTKQDIRAQFNIMKLATLTGLQAPRPEFITCTGANEITIDKGCVFAVGASGVFLSNKTVLNALNLDMGSGFIHGKDYYIYICDIGGTLDERYVISLNATFPIGMTADNSRKIGGFHYGRVRAVNAALEPINASGVVKGTGWEGNVYVGIVQRSVWTLLHRPKCQPEGMVYLTSGLWVDIYISSDDGKGGLASKYNATPLTGIEGLNCYDFNKRAQLVDKKSLGYAGWCNAADGSPQALDNANTNAWSATTNTGRQVTGYVPNAVSAIGCVDCVGNVWEWIEGLIQAPTVEASVWHDVMPGYGQILMFSNTGLRSLLTGGGNNLGVHSGARTVNDTFYPWGIGLTVGVRCCCDSL